MRGLQRGGLAHWVIGFAILIALAAIVQVSLPVMHVAGTASEFAPDLSIPNLDVNVPERPSWEQSVNCRCDFNYLIGQHERRELCQCSECRCSGCGCDVNAESLRDLLCTGGDRPIFLVGWGSCPLVTYNS